MCNKKTNLEVEGLVKPICQFLPCQADFGFCLTGRVLKGGFQNYLSVGGQFLIERDLQPMTGRYQGAAEGRLHETGENPSAVLGTKEKCLYHLKIYVLADKNSVANNRTTELPILKSSSPSHFDVGMLVRTRSAALLPKVIITCCTLVHADLLLGLLKWQTADGQPYEQFDKRRKSSQSGLKSWPVGVRSPANAMWGHRGVPPLFKVDCEGDGLAETWVEDGNRCGCI